MIRRKILGALAAAVAAPLAPLKAATTKAALNAADLPVFEEARVFEKSRDANYYSSNSEDPVAIARHQAWKIYDAVMNNNKKHRWIQRELNLAYSMRLHPHYHSMHSTSLWWKMQMSMKKIEKLEGERESMVTKAKKWAGVK